MTNKQSSGSPQKQKQQHEKQQQKQHQKQQPYQGGKEMAEGSFINSENAHGEVDKNEFETSGPAAPDGGYGWFVVLGCFISHVVFAGFDRSEGVLFLLLTSKFQESAQLTSWPGAVVCTLQLLLGPLATAMSNRYSHRVSVMCGAVLVFLGTLLSAFSTSFSFYFICHGFIDGIGRGMAYVPGLTMVGLYFDKRAGLAVGLATSGAGIGTFVIVPFTQYLADGYGFQGTFLILSGVACHMFIAALLYRPLKMHYRSIQAARSRRKAEVYSEFADPSNQDETNILDVNTTGTGNSETQIAPGATSVEHVYTSITNNNKVPCLETHNLPRSSKIHESDFSNDKVHHDNCLLLSLQVCCPVDRNQKQSNRCFSFHLMKNPSFIMFCLSIFTFTMAFRAAFTFLPVLIESKGIPNSQAALALSAAGAVDTFGRIGTGFFLDLPRVRPFRLALYNLVIFTVGLVAFFLPLMRTITTFYVMSGVYGLLTGAYISQKSVVLADILDPPDVASSFGILMVFQGLGCLLGPPLAGALRDVFGSYDESFYLSGGLLFLAGLLMVLCNICNLLVNRKIIWQK